MVGMNPERVLQGLEILEMQPRGESRMLRGLKTTVPTMSRKKFCEFFTAILIL